MKAKTFLKQHLSTNLSRGKTGKDDLCYRLHTSLPEAVAVVVKKEGKGLEKMDGKTGLERGNGKGLENGQERNWKR
jgi:hypothetical protein